MEPAGLNRDYLKLRNCSHVLNAILKNGVICRRDIAKSIGLTQATVSNRTAELIACGIVEEIGTDRSLGSEKGGPSPILLGISSTEPYVVGLHLGETSLQGGIVNLRGEVVAESTVPVSLAAGPKELKPLLAGLIEDLTRKKNLNLKKDLLGIGFVTAGNIAADSSVVWHKEKSLIGFSPRELLRQRFGLPVFVGNATRSMALAESWFGQGSDYQNYLFVLVHDMVDGAIVVNRSVLVGSRHFSSLLGHSPVDDTDVLCFCGQKGCPDAVASDVALRAQASQVMNKPGSMLPRMARKGALSKDAIIEAAVRGDVSCRELLVRRSAYLGKVIARVINLLDVESVIVAMNLSGTESNLEKEALALAYKENLRLNDQAPRLVFSRMKKDLMLAGPATLVIRRVFSPELQITATGPTERVASLPAV